MFSGCHSVHECVRPPVRADRQATECHQTLVDDVVQATGELVMF